MGIVVKELYQKPEVGNCERVSKGVGMPWTMYIGKDAIKRLVSDDEGYYKGNWENTVTNDRVL